MVVLFFVFSGDTLIIVSPFLSYGGIANQTRCIDDRLSFERARHRQKKSLRSTWHHSNSEEWKDGLAANGAEWTSSLTEKKMQSRNIWLFHEYFKFGEWNYFWRVFQACGSLYQFGVIMNTMSERLVGSCRRRRLNIVSFKWQSLESSYLQSWHLLQKLTALRISIESILSVFDTMHLSSDLGSWALSFNGRDWSDALSC